MERKSAVCVALVDCPNVIISRISDDLQPWPSAREWHQCVCHRRRWLCRSLGFLHDRRWLCLTGFSVAFLRNAWGNFKRVEASLNFEIDRCAVGVARPKRVHWIHLAYDQACDNS